MKSFLIRWLLTTLSVFAVTQISWSGVHADSTSSLIWAGLVLGFLNAFLRPVLMLLSLPLILLSMGLFYFVVNAVTLYLVGGIIPGFHVASFGSAIISSVLISLVSWILGVFVKLNDAPVVRRSMVMERRMRVGDEGGGSGGSGEMKSVRGRVIE